MLEKKYNPLEIEKQMQELWESKQTFKFNGPDQRDIFSIDTPPPTVSGKLHIGHVFSYTQSEMIMRYKRLSGYNVFYPFGYDDNGLPTERLVEKDFGIKAKDLPRSEFIEKCNYTTKKYILEFREMWKSLGFSVDWDLQYDTINDLSRKISQQSFIDLAKKGAAYQKEAPVLWCTNCLTSIAQAELEGAEKDSFFDYINFMIDGKPIEIATTRPEYLGACVALFINPDDERYNKYIGKKAIVPLYDFEVPVIGDKKVAIDKGTGVVMCCTYGDITDMDWQKEYNLPYKKLMLADGTVDSSVLLIGGLSTNDARKKIVEELTLAGLLNKVEKITHTVSVHERCGTPIEIIPSNQWYVDVLNIKDELIKAGDDINWHPEHMKNRYLEWVNNLKWDWCISRQRYFGVPFPVWYCNSCKKVNFPNASELPINPLEHKPTKPCSCGSNEFTPETAVMDTWATSSVTPLINMKKGEADERTYLYPMSVRSQAHEIIRTWTFYSIVKSIHHFGNVPWKDLMISGFVLAKKGEKISKSKGNATSSPSELISAHGSDMIRYWAANNRLGTDTWFAEEDILSSHRFLTKLWNASKFAIMQMEDFKKDSSVKLLPMDLWLINKCQDTKNKYNEYMNEYEIGLARLEADKFFWNDLCDNYLEIAKERLYQPEKHGYEQRKSGQQALYAVLLEVLKMYSPIVPHITEHIYQEFFREYESDDTLSASVFTTQDVDKTYVEFGEVIKELVGEVRKFKTDRGMSMKDEIGQVTISTDAKMIKLIEASTLDLKACTWAEAFKYVESTTNSYVIEEKK